MARIPKAEAQKENPDSVGAEIGVEGIEALPKRVDRYSTAKKGALDVAKYMAHATKHQAMAAKVTGCGDYLLFRHFYTVDKVKLHAAQFCKKHLLCPLCAIRRGAKALAAYLERWEAIRLQRPTLRPFLVTLTVKDGPDLAERFRHLHKAQHELWKRKHRGRGCALDGVEGAVWSYEIKRGQGSGLWHPHLHMIALAETEPDAERLSREWHQITGDSFIVDVRPISQEDPVSGFIEVFKYAVKFSDQEPSDTVHAWEILRGKRLLASSGCFRGVEVPDELTDDSSDVAGLPFMDMLYRFTKGAGYSLQYVTSGLPEPVGDTKKVRVPYPMTDYRRGLYETFRRVYLERLEQRGLEPGPKLIPP
jgi:hypothetical protein